MWKEKEKIRVENELERLKDKKQALSDHLKNAIQELPRTEVSDTHFWISNKHWLLAQ
jgi:hypothetical protein